MPFPSAEPPAPTPPAAPWPRRVADALWRGHEIGAPLARVQPSGWDPLDQELPGGGWPCRALTEVLQPRAGAHEWRLLAPCLPHLASAGRGLALVGPPWVPHGPGLQALGLPARQLIWVQAETEAERLWASEQLIRAKACGALLAWLPQASPEALRRLQLSAQGNDGLVLLFRPQAAQQQASPAPLRLLVRHGPDWALRVRVFKRCGPPHEGELHLPSVPGGLDALLTPRQRASGRWTHDSEVATDVVGRTDPSPSERRQRQRA